MANDSSFEPQIQSPRFFTLSTEKGLAQDSIYDVLLDNDGFLYIGTAAGLDRWDGYNLRRINGDQNELADMPITSLFEDSLQNIWIGTEGDGAYMLDPSTATLQHISREPYEDDPDYFQLNSNFAEDPQGRILIATDYQVNRYDYATGSIDTVFKLSEKLIENADAIRWIMTLDRWLLVATSNGLYAKLENAPQQQLAFLPKGTDNHIDFHNTKHLYKDSQDRLWISTVRGLYVTTANNVLNAIENQTEMAPANAVINERNVWRIIEKAQGEFWVGTDLGLFSVEANQGKNSYQYLFEPRKGVDVLSRRDIHDIEIDKDGNLWLASNYGGALYWSPQSLMFDSLQITAQNRENSPLTDNTIWAIHEDKNQDLWIGTDNGLTHYNPKTQESRLLYKQDDFIPFSDAYIDRLFPVDESRLIAQSGNGLWEINKQTGERKIVETQDPDNQAIVSSWVYGSGQDALGRIWFLVDSDFYIYDPFKKQLTLTELSNTFSANAFNYFLGDQGLSPAHIVVAIIGGLVLVDINTFEVTEIHSIKDKIKNAWIYPSSLVDDGQGMLWIAYPSHGLYGIDRQTYEQRYFFNDNNLLPTNVVYSLQIDKHDNLWFSSHSGLHRIDSNRDSIENFRAGRELNVAEFNDGASTTLHDGRLAFGSPSGVVTFDPANFSQKVVSEMTLDGQLKAERMTISDVELSTRELDLPINNIDGKTINLSHEDNGLTIRFSSLQFSESGYNSYTYTLSKNGQIISTTSTREPFVSLPLLDEGNYVFTVAPTNNSGVSTMQPASLNINVAPAPWNTLSAKIMYAIAATLVLLLIWWIRKGQKFHLEQARSQLRLFGDAFKQTRDWVLIFSRDYTPIAVNPAFEAAFDLDSTQSIDEQFKTLRKKYPNLMKNTQSALKDISTDGFWRSEQKIQLADGRPHDVLINLNAVKSNSDNDEIDHYLMVFSDISEQKQAERKLLKMATYDDLTGLINRNLLLDRLEHGIANAKLHDAMVAVLFIDLDRFKGINDSLGHEYGDNILRVVAKRMQNLAEQSDTVGRIGGDEFVIILEEVSDFEDVSHFIAELVELIEEPIQVRKETLRISCSIGVSMYPNDGFEPSDLLRYADVAMYSAKGDAVNSFRFFTESMNVRARYRLSLENLVKRAYQQELFFNVYQPIVNLNTQQTEGMELLMRCAISEQSISPAEFVPILEEMRLIVEVTRVSIIAGIKELAQWYKSGFKGYLSVNLSALHFTAAFDLDILAELLDRYKLPRSALRFEVTEGVLMGDKETALEQFKALNNEGYKLALDDFGTGYSSLSYLKIFPLDVLKIDKSFSDDIGNEANGDSLIITTIGMAKNLHMDCIAEGIETEEQVLFLAEQNCYLLQGYFFSKPVTADMAKSVVTKQWAIPKKSS